MFLVITIVWLAECSPNKQSQELTQLRQLQNTPQSSYFPFFITYMCGVSVCVLGVCMPPGVWFVSRSGLYVVGQCMQIVIICVIVIFI